MEFIDLKAQQALIKDGIDERIAAVIESAITDKTKAIMHVGIYGQSEDLQAINLIAEKHGGIFVIEDRPNTLVLPTMRRRRVPAPWSDAHHSCRASHSAVKETEIRFSPMIETC